MKWLRVTALGLLVGLCVLAAAPAAQAEDTWVPGRSSRLGAPGEWVSGWVARLAEWLGWGVEEPRAVIEAAGGGGNGSGDPTGGPPGPSTECSGSVDPDGTPCRP